MNILFLLLGLIIGALAAAFIVHMKMSRLLDAEKEARVESETGRKLAEQKAEERAKASEEAIASEREYSEKALAKEHRERLDELERQKAEYDKMEEKFRNEFKVMAADILKDNSEKFTRMNSEKIGEILNPLNLKLEDFKKQINDVYDRESKQRFSLGERVKELANLNEQISKDANNLTKALKGEAKTQGDWGEMILASILEKSGLIKGEQYELQEFLRDDDGNYLKNEQGNRMQPDAVITYPDSRKVIIDSKVSLTAYTRFAESDDPDVQKKSIQEHLRSVRQHIMELSDKHYWNYTTTFDAVIMFIPNEPAYLLALQYDNSLWEFAYGKRVLLMSPTHLITALKLVENLWVKENQSRNALEIARRGAALYDKFSNFVKSLKAVGDGIDKAREKYETAFKQLSTGNGNLVGQAEKLRELGIKTDKELGISSD
ncbi:MAG: DNA recombination protein RmuC [Bacteroidales bacterium]|jgi:DNA recombination protein RmuC|nr:DNA recombination protein RmuC [Bacteroidales bacterium]